MSTTRPATARRGRSTRSTLGPTCSKHRYQHKKHGNPDRGCGVSVVTTGTCDDFRVEYSRLARYGLGAHMEFFNGGGEETNGS